MKKILFFLLFISSFLTSEAQNTLPKYTGTFGKKELQHLLRRTMFGATLDDIKYFEGKSMDAVVDELLTPIPSPDVPLIHLEFKGDTLLKVGKPFIGESYEKKSSTSLYQYSVWYWWHGLILRQDRNIREKMVLFLDTHVPSNWEKGSNGKGFHFYTRVKLLREYSTGNYKEFMKKITLDPMMMRYLDLSHSSCLSYYDAKTPTKPSENYAREVQEIYTVGKGKNNNEQLFTEDDVKAAAAILSGWRLEDPNNWTANYLIDFHCKENKQFSALYNNKLITYKAGATGGKQEIDELFDMLFDRKETSENIVRKLYRYFVYAYISDDTEMNVIQPLAKFFRDSNYEFKPVLKAMLSSEHFYDKEQVGVMIKNPYDYCAGMMRMFELKYPNNKDYGFDKDSNKVLKLYSAYNAFHAYVGATGMRTSEVPDVVGFPAYYQAPDYHHHWINADFMRRRKEVFYNNDKDTTNVIRQGLYYWAYNSANSSYGGILPDLIKKIPNANNPDVVIQEMIDYFLIKDLNSSEKIKLKEKLETSQKNWKTSWETNPNATAARLTNFFELLFSYAEFQLM